MLCIEIKLNAIRAMPVKNIFIKLCTALAAPLLAVNPCIHMDKVKGADIPHKVEKVAVTKKISSKHNYQSTD